MTWCGVPAHAPCCRCDGKPETSDAYLLEQLRACIASGEIACHDDPPSDWCELMRRAVARIEQLEDFVDELKERIE